MSRIATQLSKLTLKTEISDPMSGFFMIRRDAFAKTVRNTSAIGFKILLDLFASAPRKLKHVEIPYQFKRRKFGESKMDAQAAWDYGMLLLDKTIGKFLPVRFISFSLIGGLGVLVHLFILFILFRLLNVNFVISHTIATFIAMNFNFLLNNILTYRDLRLSGWLFLRGLFSFILICSVGAVANVGIAAYIFELHTTWILSAMAGIVVGAIWNYVVTSVYTWKGKPF
jgi:dolichol-phosphate mannosyltransferase